jgi:hypothetical protein
MNGSQGMLKRWTMATNPFEGHVSISERDTC